MFGCYGIVKAIILYSDKAGSGMKRNRNLQKDLHLLIAYGCIHKYSVASLSLWVGFANRSLATGKFSLAYWVLWQERQFWNLKHFKMEAKYRQTARNTIAFEETWKCPWGVQNLTSSWAFPALLFCVQLISTGWIIKGCLKFDPVIFFIKETA